MRRVALLVVMGGCGRVAFDPLTDAGPDATLFSRCLDASFDDATSGGWTVLDGTWQLAPGAGPGGSTAFGAQGALDSTIVHPALRNLTAARISLDWRTEEPGAGDFVVQLLDAGWATRAEPRYSVALYPPGSDSSPDRIRHEYPGGEVLLVDQTSITPAATWHHVDISFAADHSFEIAIDQIPHMASGPDQMLAGPFDVTVGFWETGFIDNVVVDCAR